MKLTSRQVAFLKGLAHEKKPVILIGHKGVTESLVKETASALLIHELIKVRLGSDDGLDEEAEAVAKQSGASLVERIGKIAILYKKHPEQPRIVLPKEPKQPKEPKKPSASDDD